MAFGSQQWMYSAGGFYPHEIDNSARLVDGDYFTRTPSSSSNAETWTWSAWVKKATATKGSFFFSAGVANTREFLIYMDSTTQRLNVYQYNNATPGIDFQVITSMKFRDTSAWYHIVVAVDTSQATASNRIKVYVNGEQQTDFDVTNYPAQGLGTRNGTTEVQDIGKNAYNQGLDSDYYITEVNYISGSQLAATSFGETKADTWIPKKYTGSYGSHDFYLDFSDSTRTRETDTALVTAPFGGNAEYARLEDGLSVISNTSTGSGFTLVQYDLGSAKEVKYYIIEDLYFTGNVSTFQLQYSNDNSSWTSAASLAITNNAQDFGAALSITARYWRIQATAFGANGSARIDCLQLFTGQVAVDTSGNGNNFSSTNVLPSDVMPDSPTNNWATLNPLGPMRHGANYGTGTQTEGNLTVASTSQSYFDDTASTLYVPDQKKWYYELRMDRLDMGSGVGYVQFNIGGAYLRMWYGASSNTQIISGSTYNYSAMSNGDILMFAIDEDNSKGWFGLNGTWYTTSGTPNPAAGTGESTTSGTGMIGRVQIRNGTGPQIVTANFGQDSSFAGQAIAQGNTDANGLGDFYYAPPAGYLALCSANMPDPPAAVNPVVNNSPQDHFNTVLYTGNASSGSDPQQSVDVGLDLDFVWMKNRSSASTNHTIFDRLRGDVGLNPNQLIAEYSFSDFNMNSNNTIDAPYSSSSSYSLNTNNQAYVAWALKAGGAGVSNSDGTVTSTVSANTNAGFSIVTYTGDGASTTTIGHGLSKAPEMYIVKNRTDASTSWMVYNNQLTSGHYLILDGNNGSGYAGLWGSGPTSSVITVTSNSQTNANTKNFVAYCFHSVEGFSKFGSYTGNASSDGPFIYTGFRPAFVIWKRTDSTSDWLMLDNKRGPYNVNKPALLANASDQDLLAYTYADFLSNGFKIRAGTTGLNVNNGSYIYIAFAEMPFKYANAR